jgi:hypothetical protein
VIDTVPTAVDLVYTKKSAEFPVPVETESVDEPLDAVTGAEDVARAETIVALVATAVTTVPVSTDVTAIFNASAASILLSAGTGSDTGAVATVPPTAADPATVSVTVPALALAAGDTSIVLVRAAAMISDTFLNEFI